VREKVDHVLIRASIVKGYKWRREERRERSK
jgi:hypothetical protein